MLTDQQKNFLRRYLNGVRLPPDEADHAEAGKIWDQIAETLKAAEAAKKVVEELTAPEKANVAEKKEIDDIKAEANALLAGPLNEQNAFEAVAGAKECIARAEDAILRATTRISSDEKAWTDALGATQELIATSGLNAEQNESLRADLALVGTPAPDLGDTDALIVKLGAIKDRHKLISEAVAAGEKRVAASNDLPADLYETEISLITAAREKAVAAIAKMVDPGSIAAATGPLDTLENETRTAAQAATRRAELRAALKVAIDMLVVPDEATDGERKAITDPANSATLVLTGNPEASVLQGAIDAAQVGVQAVEAANTRIKDARAAWQAGVTKVEDSLAASRAFPLAVPQTAAVQAQLEIARKLLATDLSNVPEALAALDSPTKLLKLISEGIDTLQGDVGKVAALPADALTAEEDKYEAARAEALSAIAALIDAPGIKLAEGKIAELAKLQAAIAISVDKRKDLLKTASKAQLNAVCAALGSSEALDAIVAGVKPDASGLFDETKIAPAVLAKLYKDALAGNAEVLSEVYRTGFGSDAGKLNDFAGSLDDDQREKVTAMIKTGGFAEAPRAMGELLKAPGGADKLKDLGTTFNDASGLASLKGAVTQGGLGGANARSPDVLASVMGVIGAADLKKHIEGFGPKGMDDMRAMLSAFDGTPPPSVAGKAFATVAARVCPPDDGMKTQFFDTLDKSSAMSGASKALQKVSADPSVTAAAKALGRNPDPISEGGLNVTLAGVAALQAGEGIPGVDAAKRTLLEAAITASSASPVAMADAAKLTGDKAAAKKAAEGKLDPQDANAADTANKAATAAGLAADAAVKALVDPITADLLEEAAEAAKKAVAAARDAPDDGIRDTVLAQAEACFKAVTKATTDLGKDVAENARAAAETNAKGKSKVEGAKVTDAAGKQAAQDLYQDHQDNSAARAARYVKLRDEAAAQYLLDDAAFTLADAETTKKKNEYDEAKKPVNANKPGGAAKKSAAETAWKDAKKVSDKAKQVRDKTKRTETKAEDDRLKEEANLAAAPGKLAAAKTNNTANVKDARKTGLVAIQAASDQTEASRNAKLIADTPALQEAFAKATRLQLLADSPEATTKDHLAAAEANSEAAIALADTASGPVLAAVGALETPDLGAKPFATQAFTDADKLIAVALDVKQALALAIQRQEKAQVAYLAQERLVLDARDDVAKFGDVDPYKKTLSDEVAKLIPKEAERALAASKSKDLAAKAKAVDDGLTRHIGLHNKAIVEMTASADDTTDREEQRDKLKDAAALLVLALNRSYSAGYPSMNRDQLLSVASTMNKSSMAGMGGKDPVAGTDAKVDMEHFCGRHTREFCSFEGRDLNDYDEALGSAIMEAQTKSVPDADLTDEQLACRDSNAKIKTTSMWPGGFGKTDIEECLKLTFIEVEKKIPTLTAEPVTEIRPFLDLPNDKKTHTSTQFTNIAITYKSLPYTVQIGFSIDPTDPAKFLVGQFFPSSTPSVPFADMHALKSAMKH